MTHERPPEPKCLASAWYRGWECAYYHEPASWGFDGWYAYKGGCDLDAPQVTAATYSGLLDAIDDEEDG